MCKGVKQGNASKPPSSFLRNKTQWIRSGKKLQESPVLAASTAGILSAGCGKGENVISTDQGHRAPGRSPAGGLEEYPAQLLWRRWLFCLLCAAAGKETSQPRAARPGL